MLRTVVMVNINLEKLEIVKETTDNQRTAKRKRLNIDCQRLEMLQGNALK